MSPRILRSEIAPTTFGSLGPAGNKPVLDARALCAPRPTALFSFTTNDHSRRPMGRPSPRSSSPGPSTKSVLSQIHQPDARLSSSRAQLPSPRRDARRAVLRRPAGAHRTHVECGRSCFLRKKSLDRCRSAALSIIRPFPGQCLVIYSSLHDSPEMFRSPWGNLLPAAHRRVPREDDVAFPPVFQTVRRRRRPLLNALLDFLLRAATLRTPRNSRDDFPV